ncbi:MAG: hypothetical protein ACRC28_04355, partial [Clostridium sp.]|uniref:hypothetical protein n=1 Tax=Clostridium sp. TaxID=1506 RepID=UPI003F2A098E
MNFCKKCGDILENGVCSSCTTKSTSTTSANSSTVIESSTNAFEPKAKVEKKPMSPKTKKIIIASCVGISLCAVAFVGFTIYQGKIQEKYAKEAIALVNDGKFEDANDILTKYKKEDTSVLELKELNTLYLEAKKECEEGKPFKIYDFKQRILKSTHKSSYIDEVAKLELLSKKVLAINNLKNIDELISDGRIDTAKYIVDTCENYDLTEEEKAKYTEANAKITAALDKIKKEEDARKEQEKKEDLKTTYLNRYNTLSNDYNDAFYSSMYSKFSEAEKS